MLHITTVTRELGRRTVSLRSYLARKGCLRHELTLRSLYHLQLTPSFVASILGRKINPDGYTADAAQRACSPGHPARNTNFKSLPL